VRLILNADDFGYSADTVSATIDCLERGVVTSATILPNMPATREAIEFARQRPDLCFGVHLSFVRDSLAAPLSELSDVPRLVDSDGRLLRTRTVRLRALLHLLPVGQIETEIASQVMFLRNEGVLVSHVDSHRHVHKLPAFQAALCRALPRLGIVRMRNVQDTYLRKPFGSPTYWFGWLWRRRLMKEFETTDHFYMPTGVGEEQWPTSLLRSLRALNGDSLEIGVHPGFEEAWRNNERLCVEDFARRVREEGHELIAWKALSREEQHARRTALD